jgi:Family of unknown function (DUF5519)
MSPSQEIAAEVGGWPGVKSRAHRFGGIEFRLGRRELGHLHGDRSADLPFPRRVSEELITAGRARPHRWVPNSGWITVDINPRQIAEVIDLFRLSYERARAKAPSAP